MKLVDVRLSFPRAWNDPNDGDNIDADIYIYIYITLRRENCSILFTKNSRIY